MVRHTPTHFKQNKNTSLTKLNMKENRNYSNKSAFCFSFHVYNTVLHDTINTGCTHKEVLIIITSFRPVLHFWSSQRKTGPHFMWWLLSDQKVAVAVEHTLFGGNPTSPEETWECSAVQKSVLHMNSMVFRWSFYSGRSTSTRNFVGLAGFANRRSPSVHLPHLLS